MGLGWVGMDWIGLDGYLDAWMDGWVGSCVGIGLGWMDGFMDGSCVEIGLNRMDGWIGWSGVCGNWVGMDAWMGWVGACVGIGLGWVGLGWDGWAGRVMLSLGWVGCLRGNRQRAVLSYRGMRRQGNRHRHQRGQSLLPSCKEIDMYVRDAAAPNQHLRERVHTHHPTPQTKTQKNAPAPRSVRVWARPNDPTTPAPWALPPFLAAAVAGRDIGRALVYDDTTHGSVGGR